MKAFILYVFLLAASVHALEAAETLKQPAAAHWAGVYSSPSEIGGFSGTVLILEEDYRDELGFRMTFNSDVGPSEREIVEKEKHGEALTEGEYLYIPTALLLRRQTISHGEHH
jgi:hypothetical protein